MFDGKMKAVTFSYDDGITQDIRLIEMLNKYGLKCTFNLNSGRLGQTRTLEREGKTVLHNKISACDIRSVYQGHEIAVHTVNHPDLTKLSDQKVADEVERDRIALSELAGYEVVGMAYPGGFADKRVAEVIRECTGIKYARTVVSTHSFEPQSDMLLFNPTCHQHAEFDKMFELAERFIGLDASSPKVLYIWGHSFELDIHDTWDKLESFCRLISGKSDIFYGTNKEILL